MNTPVSATVIDATLWEITVALMRRYGSDVAFREIAPLNWYVGTGRASTEFLRRLAAAKPFMIARKLHVGGADDEIIRGIETYLGLERKE